MLVKCIDLSHEGKGVCRQDNKVIFVDNLLIGEEAEIVITEEKKKFSKGKIVKLLKTSDKRIEPVCKHFNECGGCSMQHTTYENEKEFKQKTVMNNFKKNTNVDIEISSYNSGKLESYRNKVLLHFNKEKFGFYKKESQDIVDINECVISDPFVMKIANIIKVNNVDIERVIIRSSKDGQSKMVILISRTLRVITMEEIVKNLLAIPEIKSIYHNIHPKMDHKQTGSEFKKIYGVNRLEDEINNVKFSIGPDSFYQVNPEIVEVLYTEAIKKGELKSTDNVVDAYCGIGTIGISIANSVKSVVGIELNKKAIEDAHSNKRLNGLENISFMLGRAEKMITQIDNADVIFLDPPRNGCNKKMIDTIIEKGIKRVVYISCNSATQSRDVKFLIEKGYKLENVSLYDMFPRTSHIETIAVLKKDDTNE